MARQSDLELFEQRYDSAFSDLQDRRRRYAAYYRQTLGMDDGEHRAKPWGAQVNSQHTHAQVLTFSAFIQSGLFPTWPWVFAEMYEPWTELGPRATLEYNARLRRARFYRQTYLWHRMAAIHGVGIMKLSLGDHGPQFNLIHPGNLMWDPNAENLRFDAEWVIEVNRRTTKGMLLAQMKAGLYEREPVERVLSHSTAEEDAVGLQRVERTHVNQSYAEEMDEPIVRHYMVTPSRIVEVHVDSKTVLASKPNPFEYIPYYDICGFPEAFEVQGYGIPEIGADLQDEINTLRRQRIDVRSLTANPMFTLLKSSGLDPFGIVASPGAIFPVTSPDDLRPVQVQDNSSALQSEEYLLSSDYDRIVGVMPMTRGESSPSSMKATTASIIHSNTNVRFSVDINMMLDYPIRPILLDFVGLSNMVETPIAITLAEWELLQECVDAKCVELVPHTESYIGNAVEKFQLLQQFLANAAPMMAPQGIAEVIKDMLAMIQVRDPERITRYIMANPTPDPVDAKAQGVTPGAMQGTEGAGRGVALREETARAAAPGQSGKPMAQEIAA